MFKDQFSIEYFRSNFKGLDVCFHFVLYENEMVQIYRGPMNDDVGCLNEH